MEPGSLSAVSALVGSLVGVSTSIATNWINQRLQARRQLIDAELRRREELYSEFISECSKLAIDALDHSLDNLEKILQIYALENRIKLCASPPVVAAAAQAIECIGEQYMKTNIAPGELKRLVLNAFREPDKRSDPLKPFSDACRSELASLHSAL